jgi:hypothetical protein
MGIYHKAVDRNDRREYRIEFEEMRIKDNRRPRFQNHAARPYGLHLKDFL